MSMQQIHLEEQLGGRCGTPLRIIYSLVILRGAIIHYCLACLIEVLLVFIHV